jgi:hypothetical protein
MKILKHTLYSFLFLISFTTKAQNLSISSLMKLNELNIAESENFLSKYKWTYVASVEKDGFTYLTFDYIEHNNWYVIKTTFIVKFHINCKRAETL